MDLSVGAEPARRVPAPAEVLRDTGDGRGSSGLARVLPPVWASPWLFTSHCCHVTCCSHSSWLPRDQA